MIPIHIDIKENQLIGSMNTLSRKIYQRRRGSMVHAYVCMWRMARDKQMSPRATYVNMGRVHDPLIQMES